MRYTLAEGATGAFFDADVTIANPSGVDTQVMIDFLPEGGAPVQVDTSVAANTPLQVNVEQYVPACGGVDRRAVEACAARRRTDDDVGCDRLRRSRRHVGRARESLAVRRGLAGLLLHVCAAGQRQQHLVGREHHVPRGRRRSGGARHDGAREVARHHRRRHHPGACRSIVRHRRELGAADHRRARDVPARRASVRRRPRIRRRQQREPELVPGRRRDRRRSSTASC